MTTTTQRHQDDQTELNNVNNLNNRPTDLMLHVDSGNFI